MANPNIYANLKPIDLPDPQAILTGMVQQQATIQKAKDDAQKAKDADAVRQVLSSTGGDKDMAIQKLRQIGAYGAADAIQTADTAQRAARAKLVTDQLTNQQKRNSTLSGYINAAWSDPSDDAINTLVHQIKSVPLDSDDTPEDQAALIQQLQTVPPEKRPALLDQWRRSLLTEVDQDNHNKANLTLLLGTDPIRGAAGLLAQTKDPQDAAEEYQAILAMSHNPEHRAALKASLPDPRTLTPENFEQFKVQMTERSMTPEELKKLDMQQRQIEATTSNTAVDNARADASAAEAARHNRATEARLLQAAAGGGSSAGGGDAKAIADAIVKGDQPPTLTGLYRFAAPVRAELARKGYDLTRATEDWNATQKYLNTLNGAQQTRLRQAVTFATDSLDVVEDLADKWNGGRFPALNRAQLAAAKAGAMGQNAQSIAVRLDAQISDLVSELGTVYKGGNASTDESLKLAAKNLQSDWSEKTLRDAVALVRKNLTIRSNSIKNTQPIGGRQDNPYAPDQGGATQAPAEKSVTMAELEQIAKMRKTTVEEEKARAAAAGYVVR